MNGYQKMKMARGMKVTKIVSAVTAMSMAVTSLIVAASANSTTSDQIESALGQLRAYGIVAENMETHSHFESNFAAKNLELNNNYDIGKVLTSKDRTIDFTVTTNEKFEEGEVKYYYYGVFCNGSPIEVTYQTSEGIQANSVIGVRFEEPGTKRFVINVPSSYQEDTLVIHRLGFPEEIQEEKRAADLVPVDEGVPYAPVDDAETSENIVSNTMEVAGEVFSTNKVVYVGSEIYKDIDELDDGRYSYRGNVIANNTNEFYEDANAEMKIDELISSIKTASDELSNVNTVGDNALYYEANGSVNPGSSDADAINEKIRFVKNNPDYSLLVNVNLTAGEENYVTLNSAHGVGDWESDVASRIVFNFTGGDPETTTVVLGDGFRGTVLAPDAKVRVGSTMCGAIYAPSVNVQNGEVHAAPYNFLNLAYNAYYESPEETTPEETTVPETTPVETTVPETTVPETTPVETTVPETTPVETTVPETTPVETTVPETTVPETTPVTTTEPPVTTTEPPVTTTEPPVTTTEPPVTTTEPPVTTTEPPVTTTEPPVTTTEPPVTTTEPPVTTTEPPVTTTEPPVTTTEPPVTTTEPVVTTTEPVVTTTEPVVTTTEPVVTTTEPVVTTTEPVVTTTEPVVTTTEPVVTTTEPVVTTTEPVVTTTEPVVTTTEPVVTTTEPVVTTTEPVVTTTEPVVTTTEPVVTTILTIEIDEDVPLDELILIDEEVPLADMPMNTGVDSHIGMFAAIGGGALLVGGGAQAYSVFLKKKK